MFLFKFSFFCRVGYIIFVRRTLFFPCEIPLGSVDSNADPPKRPCVSVETGRLRYATLMDLEEVWQWLGGSYSFVYGKIMMIGNYHGKISQQYMMARNSTMMARNIPFIVTIP